MRGYTPLDNYKNYFQYAYGVKDDTTYKRKPSTRKCKLKIINQNLHKNNLCKLYSNYEIKK